MRHAFFAALFFLAIAAARAEVPRFAPEFAFLSAGQKARSLKSLRGQAVVVVISNSTKNGKFRHQMRNLESIYQEFASKQVVLVAAAPTEDGRVPSNVPVAVATDPAAVSAAYGGDKRFHIAIIGQDGNLDYQTGKVLTGPRIRDVIQNSFAVQQSARRVEQ